MTSATRRRFLRQLSSFGAAGVAAPWALNLAAFGQAAAASGDDYRALVCVFLYGANDAWNTVVPFDDASHAAYAAARPAFAYTKDALRATELRTARPLPGRASALAPELAPLLPLYGAGRLAVLQNVGTLVVPTTRAQYLARSVPLPPKLFSHNDQQSVWQSSQGEGALAGWGGRMAELLGAGRGDSTFSCVSLGGKTIWLQGDAANAYSVAPSGPGTIEGLARPVLGSPAVSEALRTLVTGPGANAIEEAVAAVNRRAIDAGARLRAALGTVREGLVAVPDNPLAAQLDMVARMIAARHALGAKRQVFMVSLGGFDTHSRQADVHPGLLATLGSALAAFDAALRGLGVDRDVTTFTASEFGRALASNGDGCDHGWGGVQFVLGGAVHGGLYGTPPTVAVDGPDDVGSGRLVPTIAVDQMASTLGSWFGVSHTDLRTVLPNLGNFHAPNVGFV